MNIFWKTIAFAIIIALVSCVSGGKKTETKDAEEVGSIKYDQIHEINTDLSIITWEGFKPTGTHVGTIAFKNGEEGVELIFKMSIDVQRVRANMKSQLFRE
jgi:hypothetical protein